VTVLLQMVLIGIITVLIAFVMYMALQPHPQPVQRGSKLAHFTIPVLSPFASVVGTVFRSSSVAIFLTATVTRSNMRRLLLDPRQ